jgi:HPt (histidine-containing phosphotransfer) domain-containing protein
MDSFLAKPFTQAQLAKLLQPVAAARGTLLPPKPAAVVERVNSPTTAPATPTTDEPDLSATATVTLLDTALYEEEIAPRVPVLDEEQVLAIRGLGKPQIFERLCDMLFASAPEALRRIAVALEAGELEAAGAAAHSLKSAVNNLGGRRLAEQLDAFENAVLEQADLQTARRAASGFAQAYAQLETALRAQTDRRTGT